MLQRLHLPARLDGSIWKYATSAVANRRHRHAELELNLVTRGSGTYLVGNLRYEIRRGDLLWLFPAQEHVLIDQSSDFEMWVGVFRRRAIRRVAIDVESRPLLQKAFSEVCCRRLAAPQMAQCEQLLAELAPTSSDAGFLNTGLAYVLLYAWRSFLAAQHVPVRTLHPSVERAARLIRDDVAELSLAEIAREAALSPSRLSRLFRQQTGTTMVEFRNRQRIERFQQIYGDGTQRKLLDAALEAGFGSYPQFHRVFRRIVGCSPADYQRRRSA